MILENCFVSPLTTQQLLWNADKQALFTADGQESYPFKEGVFNLLPQTTNKQEKGEFDYADHYQKDAEVFDYFKAWEDPAAVHENQRLHEMILAQAPVSAKRILDVGCGSAWVARHFQDKDVKVYSMDISSINPKKAVDRYPFDGHYGIIADVFHLPFAAGTFDYIVASEIIEHVADPAAFLRSLLQVLAPNGHLVVTTPHDEKRAYSLCIHCNQPTPHHAHLHCFTADSIRNLLPANVRAGATTKTFMNKLLLHGRTHPILRRLGFRLWRMIDSMANLLIPKTARLMMVVKRGEVVR
jgi:2-polyprenyl-3-methyl-5-hydroxy-6-metoxy-1,4-benzoquinol methylase